jgi:cytochrome c
MQVVDQTSATRGRSLYIVECVTCHGATARGSGDDAPPALQGPDLVRSNLVFHDRYGSTLGPFLKNGHPLQSGNPSANLSNGQIVDLSNFLHKQIDETLSGGAYTHILNVLTGDPKAGEAYFNSAGKCNTCHSPTGDLAGIAKRYDPPTLQQQFVFPRSISRDNQGHITAPKPVTVTVVLPNGSSVSGVLDQLDDFSVSLTDSSGNYHSWTRSPTLKVEKHDPYQAHIELLDRITDKNIHDVVAYLETLQ